VFASKIVERALALNFERCGVVGVDKMKGFGEKLTERIERFPESEGMYRRFFSFADPREQIPWAASVVVCSWRYGVYSAPKGLEGRIGKSYLFDERRDSDSEGYRARAALQQYMTEELGLRVAASHDYGITSCRWAAHSAGIGTIRNNNFFYGDHGSYYSLSVFLTDREMEYIHTPTHKPCSDGCGLCVKNCPTGALAAPYAMRGVTCVSFLTNKAPNNALFERYSSKIGDWIYGCDVCQDVCPFNHGQTGDREFPGLEELSGSLSLENIVTMDYGFLRSQIVPKFWYIEEKDVWKWKRNALFALLNRKKVSPDEDDRRKAAFAIALEDEDPRIRVLAEKISEKPIS
jgi:epoxyqueuosine reductase